MARAVSTRCSATCTEGERSRTLQLQARDLQAKRAGWERGLVAGDLLDFVVNVFDLVVRRLLRLDARPSAPPTFRSVLRSFSTAELWYCGALALAAYHRRTTTALAAHRPHTAQSKACTRTPSSKAKTRLASTALHAPEGSEHSALPKHRPAGQYKTRVLDAVFVCSSTKHKVSKADTCRGNLRCQYTMSYEDALRTLSFVCATGCAQGDLRANSSTRNRNPVLRVLFLVFDFGA
eukprot:1312711-Rhodomonas_salina.2